MKLSGLILTQCLWGITVGFGIAAISDLLIAPNYNSLTDSDLVLFNIATIVFVAFMFIVAVDFVKSEVWLYKVWLYALAVAAVFVFLLLSPMLVTFWRTVEILNLAIVIALLAIPILVFFYFRPRQDAFIRYGSVIRKWPRILTSAVLLMSVPVLLIVFFALSILGVIHQIMGDREEYNSVENNRYIVTQYYYLGFGVTTTGFTRIVGIDKKKWPRAERELYQSDKYFEKMQLGFFSDSQLYISPRPWGDSTIVSLNGR